MALYEVWADRSGQTFPNIISSVDEKALDPSTALDFSGMFVDALDVPASSDLPGFLRQRVDFDIEFDDSAELILADLEICETDSQDDLACKLAALRSYSERMRLRESVKAFAVHNGLLSYHDQVNAQRYRTAEESDLRGKLRPAQRFFESREAFEEFVQMILAEQRMILRLQSLERQQGSTGTPADSVVLSKMSGQAEADTDDTRPNTRSRSGLETRRGNRGLEEDCNKIRELLGSSSTVEALASTLSPKEQEIVGQIGLSPETFAILRNAEFAWAEDSGKSTVDVTLVKHGRIFSLEAHN